MNKLNEFYRKDTEYQKFFESQKYKKSDVIIISDLYSNIHATYTERDDIPIENLYNKVRLENKEIILAENGAVFGAGDMLLNFLNKNKDKFLNDKKLIFSDFTKKININYLILTSINKIKLKNYLTN